MLENVSNADRYSVICPANYHNYLCRIHITKATLSSRYFLMMIVKLNVFRRILDPTATLSTHRCRSPISWEFRERKRTATACWSPLRRQQVAAVVSTLTLVSTARVSHSFQLAALSPWTMPWTLYFALKRNFPTDRRSFPSLALAPALAFFDFRKLFSRTRATVSLVPREDKEEKYNFEV